jgi:transposase
MRIVIERLRSEQSVCERCRLEGIAAKLYDHWSKHFLEAVKKQLAGDTVREATSGEVKPLRSENHELKVVVAEITIANRLVKKSCGSCRVNLSSTTPITSPASQRESQTHAATGSPSTPSTYGL